MSDPVIKVILVDDSAVIRAALSKILSGHGDIKIASSVENGALAVDAAKINKPDIAIVDVEMPVMDGLTALPKILEASPHTKVIMFSSLTEKGAAISLKAMSLGAVECIAKPSSTSVPEDREAFETSLLQTIRSLGAMSKRERGDNSLAQQQHLTQPSAGLTLKTPSSLYQGRPNVIAIGSSTGGPKALLDVTYHFKDFNIPILITQHMPATFTKILAQHIQQHTGITSHEAEEGMIVENGHIYVAQGGFHMVLEKNSSGQTVIKLDNGPQENFCKPSVEPMFRSLYSIYGKAMLAVMLTGMGNDGIDSSQMIVENGVRLIAQDEATSVVWGMPGAVAKAGICMDVLPLEEIGPKVKRLVTG